jgi:hypothetical protein
MRGGSIMTWAYINAGAVATSSTTSITPVLPSGISLGSLLIIFVNTTSTTNPTIPSGYTSAVTGSDTNTRLCVWYKIATASESNPAISVSSGGNTNAVILAYSGVSALDVLGTSKAVAASTSFATNSLTTTTRDDFVVSVFSGGFAIGTWTSPSGVNTRITVNPSGSFDGLLIVDESVGDPSATTVRTATISTSHTGSTFALSFSSISGFLRMF